MLFIDLNILSQNENAKGKISKYLLEYPNDVRILTASKVAKECFVANSYITKFVKELGYESFTAFKYELYEQRINGDLSFQADPDGEQYLSKINTTISNNINFNQATKYEQLALQIANANKIILYGIGGSGIVCHDFYLKLFKLGLNVIYEQDEHLRQISLQQADEHSVVIIFSFSGMFIQNNDLLADINKDAHVCLISRKAVLKNFPDYITHHIEIEADESVARDYSMLSRVALFMVGDLVYLKLRAILNK